MSAHRSTRVTIPCFSRPEDLFSELCTLEELIEQKYPQLHPLRKTFAATLAPARKNDAELPPMNAMVKTKRAFYRLRPSEQRHILNWRPDPDRPSMADLMGIIHTNYRVRRQLVLCCHHDGRPFGVQECLLTSLAPVQVFIREGVTKKKAVRRLSEFMALIEAQWDGLIDDPGT